MTKIGIIGAGAWGSALAHVMANEGKEVRLWCRTPEIVATIEAMQENDKYLPGIRLNETIKVTESLSKTAESDVLLVVVPAQYLRKTLEALKAEISAGKPVLICSKGVELDSGFLPSQIAASVIPGGQIGILTGPTFANDIAKNSPSAMTLAIEDEDLGRQLVEQLSLRLLRLYYSDDVIGAQIGGAVKNVIAIACGAVIGRGLGESSRAALVTRGLTEMSRLATAMGAKKQTLMGMCGVGDLMLTCTSMQSRNYSFGVEIGKGGSAEDIIKSRHAVTEGFYTSKALMTLAHNNAVDMPICRSVYECLNEGLPLHEAIEKMLDRPVKQEGV